MATNTDIPTISSTMYASSTVPMGMTGGEWDVGGAVEDVGRVIGQGAHTLLRRVQAAPQAAFVQLDNALADVRREMEGKDQMALRIVQVFIADIDENIPVEKRVLYQGTQKITDATNEELFFEIPIAELLKAHNEMRAKTVNKKIKDRTEYLEPARIRDLKMVVTTAAEFK